MKETDFYSFENYRSIILNQFIFRYSNRKFRINRYFYRFT